MRSPGQCDQDTEEEGDPSAGIIAVEPERCDVEHVVGDGRGVLTILVQLRM
jgi:hypothetical protein